MPDPIVQEIAPGGDVVAAIAAGQRARASGSATATDAPGASAGGARTPTPRARRPSAQAKKWSDEDLVSLSYLLAAVLYAGSTLYIDWQKLPDYVAPTGEETDHVARPLARMIARRISIPESGDFTDATAALAAIASWLIRVHDEGRARRGTVPNAFYEQQNAPMPTSAGNVRPVVPPQAINLSDEG